MRVVLAAVFAVWAAGAMAQDMGMPVGPELPNSPILTLDEERLLEESRFGLRLRAEVEAAQSALIAENRAIEAELTDEERALAERRASMTAEAFRPLAEAFDARVGEIRQRQDSKLRDLVAWREAERQRFYSVALTVLETIIRDAGAVAILSDQAIVLSYGSIDITDAAIARIDLELGDGGPDPTDGDSAAPEPGQGDAGSPATGTEEGSEIDADSQPETDTPAANNSPQGGQ